MAITTRTLSDEACPQEIATPCPACGSQLFDVLLTPEEVRQEREWLVQFHRSRAGENKDLSDFTQSEETYIVSCRSCGTVLRNPRPNATELTKRYQGDVYGERTLREMIDSERDFFASKAATFRSLVPGSKVLEVGSFVGAFLEAGRGCGWHIQGVDIGDETVEFCRANGHLVVKGDLSAVGDLFDAVFIWNTFDQLPFPGTTLHHVRKLLRPGGLLVLRFPNGAFETAAVELRRARPRSRTRVMAAMAYNNFLTFPYLAGYTSLSISRLLRDSNFEVVSISGDTILPLHLGCDEARAEERRYKRATMRACSLTEELTCPWLDVVASPSAL